MNENEPISFEKNPESFPSTEEVRSVFEQIIEGEFETERKLEDENGVYLWEVIVPGEDGKTEYGYTRKGRYAEVEASTSSVHVVFYDKEEIPRSGHDVAEYIDGKWNLTI